MLGLVEEFGTKFPLALLKNLYTLKKRDHNASGMEKKKLSELSCAHASRLACWFNVAAVLKSGGK